MKGRKKPALGYGGNGMRRIVQDYGHRVDPFFPPDRTPAAQAALDALGKALKPRTANAEQLHTAWQAALKESQSIPHSLLGALFQQLAAPKAEAPGAWVRAAAVALYFADQEADRPRSQLPLTPSKLVPWLWRCIERRRAADVVAFWEAVKRDPRAQAKAPLYMPLPLLSALVAGHALAGGPLSAFLLDFLPLIKAPSGVTVYLDTGEYEASVPKDLAPQARAWIRQAELALMWSRNGNEGMQGRPRRWADRRLADLLTRTWATVVEAAVEGRNGWLKIDWTDHMAMAPEEKGEAEANEAAAQDEEDGVGSESAVAQHLKEARLTPLVVGSFLLSFLRLKIRDKATSVWSWIDQHRLPRLPLLWQHVILGHGRGGDAEAAQATFDHMTAPKDVYAHAALARAYFLANREAEGVAVISRILQDPEFQPVPTPVMNRLFGVLLRRRQGARAWAMLDRMPREGAGSPSIFTVNIFLAHGLARRKFAPDEFQRALQLLGSCDVQPDAATYTCLFQAFLQDGDLAQAEQVRQQMTEAGLAPNDRMYASLIHYHLCVAEPKDFHRALALVPAMEQQGLAPNEFIYADLIRELSGGGDFKDTALFKGQNPDLAIWPDAIARALWLLERAKRKHVPVNSVAYNSLLAALFELETPKATRMALALFDDMRSKRKGSAGGPPPATWFLVLDGLANLGQWMTAAQLVRDMHASGFRAETGALKTVVNQILQRTA